MTAQNTYKLLLNGFDTIECSYYLEPLGRDGLDFDFLFQKREKINLTKRKSTEPIKLGNSEFLIYPHGTKSGYPFLIENQNFKIAFGEFNNPNFYVIFPSKSLWENSAFTLHEKFLDWALSIGYQSYTKETLSRIDYCFDFNLPKIEIDFDEDSFVSRSIKNYKYRENKNVQTFAYGKSKIVMRVYDKVAEIKESNKEWFFELWKQKTDVWRIEWQVRNDILKRFEIRTFDDLKNNLGDLLHYLATEHDTLKTPSKDSNKSRWSLHPLWELLINEISKLNNTGIYKVLKQQAPYDLQLLRIATNILGNLKRVAAIECIQNNLEFIDYKNAFENLQPYFNKIHNHEVWYEGVEQIKKEIELGKW